MNWKSFVFVAAATVAVLVAAVVVAAAANCWSVDCCCYGDDLTLWNCYWIENVETSLQNHCCLQ